MNYFLPLSSWRIMNGLELKVNTNVSFNTDRTPRDYLSHPALVDYAGSWMRSSASDADLRPVCTWNVLFCICAVLFQGQRDCRGTTFLSLLHHSCQSSRRLSFCLFTTRALKCTIICTPFILLYPVVLLSQAGNVSPATSENATCEICHKNITIFHGWS